MKPGTTTPVSTIAFSAGAGVDRALLEELFDHTPDIAFFIKDAAGRYTTVNNSMVERHGLRSKAQMIGRRPCDVCAGSFGRIPTEQDVQVLRSGHAIVERLELHWLLPHRPVWCLRAPIPSRDIQPEIAAALLHLETSYAEPISPSSLASIAKMPAARFVRSIKRIFGITPVQLITKTRIAAGSQSLRDPDRTVADIAHQCGFSDHSAFTRAFRAATGVTPTEFRKTHGWLQGGVRQATDRPPTGRSGARAVRG